MRDQVGSLTNIDKIQLANESHRTVNLSVKKPSMKAQIPGLISSSTIPKLLFKPSFWWVWCGSTMHRGRRQMLWEFLLHSPFSWERKVFVVSWGVCHCVGGFGMKKTKDFLESSKSLWIGFVLGSTCLSGCLWLSPFLTSVRSYFVRLEIVFVGYISFCRLSFMMSLYIFPNESSAIHV